MFEHTRAKQLRTYYRFWRALIALLFFSEMANAIEVDLPTLEVSVFKEQLKVAWPQDFLENSKQYQLFELSPFEANSAWKQKEASWAGGLQAKPLMLPRFEKGRDRLYSRWALVEQREEDKNSKSDPETRSIVTSWNYGQPLREVSARDEKLVWPKSPKGLQCVVDLQDALDLGTKYVAQNVDIGQLIDLTKKSDLTWDVDGTQICFHKPAIANLDQYVSRMTKAGVNVSLILLNYLARNTSVENPLRHPLTNVKESPNRLGAFNLSDEKGYLHYRAVVEFLADRYSSNISDRGQISGIIIGNELQAHWWWYNLGEVEPEVVVSEYAKALRVAELAVRKSHSEVRVYVSMEHHWTSQMVEKKKRFIPGRTFLDQLHHSVVAEGDFAWHLAFHPYPQDLFNPRTWNDEQATYDFASQKITFKNLEVLTEYLKQPHYLYGKKSRRIILSEQGFHAGKNKVEEKVQAAAYAYAFYRTKQFPNIDMFVLHRHVDHAHEGGLKLGLRANKVGTVSAPGEKRFIYDVFKQADSENWEDVFEFAKPLIGISDWNELNPQQVKQK